MPTHCLTSHSADYVVSYYVEPGEPARTEVISAAGHGRNVSGELIFFGPGGAILRRIPAGEWACVEPSCHCPHSSVPQVRTQPAL